jgi:hypothetical protein
MSQSPTLTIISGGSLENIFSCWKIYFHSRTFFKGLQFFYEKNSYQNTFCSGKINELNLTEWKGKLWIPILDFFLILIFVTNWLKETSKHTWRGTLFQMDSILQLSLKIVKPSLLYECIHSAINILYKVLAVWRKFCTPNWPNPAAVTCRAQPTVSGGIPEV